MGSRNISGIQGRIKERNQGFAPPGSRAHLSGMPQDPVLFCFDYLDPLSYLVQSELTALGDDVTPKRIPVELQPPPAPLLDPDGEGWAVRWSQGEAGAREIGIALAQPRIIPWTRKAHEFVLHADEKGVGDAAHIAVFRAVFGEGRDIGRVDVLVEIGRGLGLDAAGTKVVLDVDRHAAEVGALREEARRRGVVEPPALICGTRVLQGFHNRDALRTFLLR